jgi:hypothetical protein
MHRPGHCLAPAGLALAAALAVSTVAGHAAAESVIKRPGAHPRYSVELDPHLVLQHSRKYFRNLGLGVGFRASIPVIEQGPIKTINNSMAISFGLDWAHFSESDWNCGRYWWGGRWDDRRAPGPGLADCTGNQFWFPVAWQWNFWLTDIISVFGEPGLAIRHSTASVPCWNNWAAECTDSRTDLQFVFWGGGRFMFGDTVGMTVRLGWPSINIGATFLL